MDGLLGCRDVGPLCSYLSCHVPTFGGKVVCGFGERGSLPWLSSRHILLSTPGFLCSSGQPMQTKYQKGKHNSKQLDAPFSPNFLPSSLFSSARLSVSQSLRPMIRILVFITPIRNITWPLEILSISLFASSSFSSACAFSKSYRWTIQ